MLKESLSSRATPKNEYGLNKSQNKKKRKGYSGVIEFDDKQVTFKHTRIEGEAIHSSN
jgi:hypothetical protein